MRRGEGGRGIVVNMGYGYSKEVGYEQREGDLLIGMLVVIVEWGEGEVCAKECYFRERGEVLPAVALLSRKTYRC